MKSDNDIRRDIQNELVRMLSGNAEKIDVHGLEGAVTPTGRVEGDLEKRNAEDAVRRVPGARGLINETLVVALEAPVIGAEADTARRWFPSSGSMSRAKDSLERVTHHIITSLLAKANDIAVLGEAAGTLAKGVIRWVGRSAPRLAGAVETLVSGVARRAAWNAFDLIAALGSLTAGLARWLGTAGDRRSK